VPPEIHFLLKRTKKSFISRFGSSPGAAVFLTNPCFCRLASFLASANLLFYCASRQQRSFPAQRVCSSRFLLPGCDSRFSWPPDFLIVHAAVLVSLHLRSWVAGARFSSPYSIFLRELFVPPPDSKYMFSAVERPSVCCLTRFGRAAIQVRCSV
jgi:hypothetical protein